MEKPSLSSIVPAYNYDPDVVPLSATLLPVMKRGWVSFTASDIEVIRSLITTELAQPLPASPAKCVSGSQVPPPMVFSEDMSALVALLRTWAIDTGVCTNRVELLRD